MAAVRCMARRIGGSLLQPRQTAIAEERHRLVPSRFVRSRQLSGEVPSERSQAAERLLLEPGWVMRSRQLASEIQNPKKKGSSALESEYLWALETLNASCDRLEELQKATAPSAFKSGVMAYGRAAKTVVRGTAKAMFCFCMITSLIFGDKGWETQAVANETSEDELVK